MLNLNFPLFNFNSKLNHALLYCADHDIVGNSDKEIQPEIQATDAIHDLLLRRVNETAVLATGISNKLDKKIINIENKLSTILSNISEAIIITDSAGNIKESNKSAKNIFKISDSFDNKNILEFLPSLETLDKNRDCIQCRALTSQKYELRVELSINPIDDDQIVYVIRDKTKEFEDHRLLDNERRLLNTVMNSVDDFVLVKDCENRWILLNECGRKLFGFFDREYLNKTTEEIIGTFPELSKCINMQHRLTDNLSWESKEPVRTKEELMINGVSNVYDVIKTPLFYNNESKRDLVIIGRNITNLSECC